MTEPKRYTVFIPELNPMDDSEVFSVDDPALAEWKRKADALDKLEEALTDIVAFR